VTTAELLARVAAKDARYARALNLPGPAAAPPPVGEKPAPAPRSVVVPAPPRLTVRGGRTSRRAVVTGVVGDHFRALFSVTGPYHSALAKRVGADLLVLDWPGHPDWPMSSKFAFCRVFDAGYDEALWADADVLFRPGCADPFALTTPGTIGGFDELPVHLSRGAAHRTYLDDYRRLRERMGFPPGLPPRHYNSGVVVVPASAADLFEPPSGPIEVGHCAEQDYTNARVWASGHPFTALPMIANWQNWVDPEFARAPPDAVLHWSGSGQCRAKRLESVRKWAARFPLPAR
jgi:hypothetical protein